MYLNIYNLNPYFLFIIGAVILYYSSELIINNSLSLSKSYNVSKITIGIIALALGTSLPELFSSIIASMKGNNNIVIGNIMGSNIANIGLVLAIAALIKPMFIDDKNDFSFNLISLLIITSLFSLLLLNDDLVKIEGAILIISFMIYLILLITFFSKENNPISTNNKKTYSTFFYLIIGFIMIYFGSDLFINGAIGISNKLGLNDLIIGMTIVSIGTSAPELFTTFAAIKKNENQLALGNVIGSNIINIVLVGGFLSFSNNIYINFDRILYQNYIMLGLTLLLFLSIFIFSKIDRFIGFIFICIYLIFIFINF